PSLLPSLSLFNAPPPPESYSLSLHDALPISDKLQAAKLLELIDGTRCVDCGRLEMARITESLTALLISVNARYKAHAGVRLTGLDRKSTRLNSSHVAISYAVFCLKKKRKLLN